MCAVAFRYPEIKATTEAKAFKAENVTSVAFIFQDRYNETGGIQRNTLYSNF